MDGGSGVGLASPLRRIHHAPCNAHHLRELKFIEELEDEPWATAMRELLQGSLHHLNLLERRGKRPGLKWTQKIEAQYEAILKRGYRAYRECMPKRPPPPRSGPRTKRDTGHNLLHRLHFYRTETLRYLHDPRVPFTNNQAEQDLRMSKVKQKISGCFRSFLATGMKQGRNPDAALANLFPPLTIETT